MLRLDYIILLLVAACAIGFAQSPATPEDEKGKKDEQQAIPRLYQNIVIRASVVEPQVEQRNAEVFRQTLFSRDDQVLHLVAAGVDAGQHEGGGKSIEVRRFGFNLDHGGVNGGLKILVDNIQQNQTTQGHGQGYLGSLKTLSPELVEEVDVINGPFSAEYGDFSGLGVVHIRLRQSLPERWTVRLQGGSYGTGRAFLAFSPSLPRTDAFFAYEGSYTGGPFLSPLRYTRHNVTGNWTRRIAADKRLGIKINGGTNEFHSSGQVPLDEVSSGRLSPFGFIDQSDGGRGRAGTIGLYYSGEAAGGAIVRVDGFLSRSWLDLFSNFTFFLHNAQGDAFTQHDSRLQQGGNLQYLRPHKIAGASAVLTAGSNFHASEINVGLYPRIGRTPTGVTTRAQANVTNGAGYVQESIRLWSGRVQLNPGLRFDAFRFGVQDRLTDRPGVVRCEGLFQPKLGIAYTPSARVPATLYLNYGRGISSTDARSVAQAPGGRHVATTDFHQVGTSHRLSRFSATTDFFWIDRSNELVYVPDDGSMEFKGPSRAYGYEGKLSVQITRNVSLDGGLTKVLNAFYRGAPRLYVDRAPHFAANAGLTVANWRGWSGSLRMRAINHYRLDPEDPAVAGAGHTVFDLSLSRRVRSGVDFNLAFDNLTDRLYYETQNYFESRLPGQPPLARIHATPGYPLTITAGVTFHLKTK